MATLFSSPDPHDFKMLVIFSSKNIEVAQNSFCFLETFRTRCDLSCLELYCFEWLCYFSKVPIHCTFHGLCS